MKSRIRARRVTVLVILFLILMGTFNSESILAEEVEHPVYSATTIPGPAVRRIGTAPSDSYTVDDVIKIKNCSVSAEKLYDIALSSYYAGVDEFFINAASGTGDVLSTDIVIEVTELPFGDGGKMNSFGILTDAGYLQITGFGARKLFDEYLYKSIEFRIKTSKENRYAITIHAEDLEGNRTYFSDDIKEYATFTVMPEGALAGKTVKCYHSWYAGSNPLDCRMNEDGSVTFPVWGKGHYRLQEKKEPIKGPTYTLDLVNESYGAVELDENNVLSIGAISGCYIQEVIVNGVSKGPIDVWNVSEGDVIKVIFAKTDNETSEEANRAAKLKTGVQATQIIANTSTAKKGVRITWTKSKGYKMDYYQVFRSLKKSSGFGTKAFYETKSGNTKSYTNTKSVKKGQRYYYKVRGVRVINGKKVYSKWSNKVSRIAV